ncbi:hypothetical protein [Methylomicrobium lacus]|uniref:hypothetical protein n=1 Tax=Methylomicrobium lacus TaxID=136992 RepID=UPI0035A93C56
MNQDAIGDENPGQAATRGDPVSGFGVLEEAQSLWYELCGLTHDRFRLAALETQGVGKSLVDMIVAGVMVGVLLIGAWLGLMPSPCWNWSSMTSWQRVATYCLPLHSI